MSHSRLQLLSQPTIVKLGTKGQSSSLERAQHVHAPQSSLQPAHNTCTFQDWQTAPPPPPPPPLEQ